MTISGITREFENGFGTGVLWVCADLPEEVRQQITRRAGEAMQELRGSAVSNQDAVNRVIKLLLGGKDGAKL